MPWLVSLAASLALGSAVMPLPAARLVLNVDSRLPESLVRPAVDEAARIWAPHGVSIVLPEATPLPPGFALNATLAVRVADDAQGDAWSTPFGSIRFHPDGPESTILLHYDAVLRSGLQTVVLGGARESQWPRSLRTQVLARMIGRVIAHEVGHWLLGSRAHSRDGLMRASHPVSELAEPGRAGFALSAPDVTRLHEVLAR